MKKDANVGMVLLCASLLGARKEVTWNLRVPVVDVAIQTEILGSMLRPAGRHSLRPLPTRGR